MLNVEREKFSSFFFWENNFMNIETPFWALFLLFVCFLCCPQFNVKKGRRRK
jgi:hypothetical protein